MVASERKTPPDRTLLEIRDLKKYFPLRKTGFSRSGGEVKAVDGISFSIQEGETLGLVGESGCGKTTAGRTILRLIPPSAGQVILRSKKLAAHGEEYKEVEIATASGRLLKYIRRNMQIIFQDPYSSLNPRMTLKSIIEEPLIIHRKGSSKEREAKVLELLAAVGMKPDHARRYPHEISGGQRQRVGIARALALDPEMVVLDEPVSALDVSIQAQVVNLLEDLQARFGLTYLFIAHDLAVIKHISSRVAVMYLGKIVELSETEELFAAPKHPYTEALISAIPVPSPTYRGLRILLPGDVPSPVNPPSGCHFHPRCRYAQSDCKEVPPVLRDVGTNHFVSCHYAESLALKSLMKA